MKQQVVIIHGGNTFKNYDDYIDDLENKEIDIEKLKYHLDWKDSITTDLGDKFEVLLPKMPNSNNAKYKEWAIWFKRLEPYLVNNVILIGHSLGGIFLAKYLSIMQLPISIKAVILVAAPYDLNLKEYLKEFELPKTLKKLDDQTSKIILFQSEDDVVVPYNHVKLYKKELPKAKLMTFKNKGHFNIEHFPELVAEIKKLVTD